MALTLLAGLPAFINLASERIFEEEKALLLRAAAVLALPGALSALRSRRLLRNPIAIAFAAFILMLLVAALAGVAPREAFAGAYLRRDGMLTWLSLAVLFCAMCEGAGTAAGRERMLGAIVIGSIWPSLYALLQYGGLDPVRWVGVDLARAIGTFGSPIYLGGYLAVVMPISALYVWRSKGWAAVLALQFAALVVSGSRGPLVALAVAAVVFAIAVGWSQIPRRVAIGAVLALGIGAAAAMSIRGPAGGLLSGGTGSTRVHVLIWKSVATLMRHSGGRLWIGHGPESLRRVLPPYYSEELGRLEGSDAMPDRAHNETLDTLVVAGVPGVALEFAFFAAALAGVARIRDRRLRAALFAAAAGHMIEIQFGIASVPARLIFLSIAAVATAPNVDEQPGDDSTRWWHWLIVPAAAAASSAWLPALTSFGSSTPASGTADDLVRYLSDISLATPLVYAVMFAAAFILARRIARASSGAASTGIRAAALVAGLSIAIPLSITPSRADDFSHGAASFERQQQWLEATIAYREATRMQPSEPFYWTGLGRSLTQQAISSAPPQRDEYLRNAHDAFERAYELNPADPDYSRHLASVLRISASMLGGDARKTPLDEADRLYAAITRFVPRLPTLWVEWGYTDVDRNELPEALNKAARALALDDRRVDAWLLRARVLGQSGRREEAVTAINAGLALAPDDAGLLDLRARLAR